MSSSTHTLAWLGLVYVNIGRSIARNLPKGAVMVLGKNVMQNPNCRFGNFTQTGAIGVFNPVF